MTEPCVIVEKSDRVAVITLNRPRQMNALSNQLMHELAQALDALEKDPEVACMVLRGSDTCFVAGADVQEMKDFGFSDVYQKDFITFEWERLKHCRKPVIAAVSGYALGGGCELTMMCDIIYAADNAVFGMPEVKLGVLPGAGGTQRLPRAIGKAKAMEMCLSARNLTAQEAEQAGLISRVVAAADLMAETMKCAQRIAGFSLPVLMMVKECVNRAYEGSLGEGLMFERRVFHSAFALEDRREGMTAFVEKRKPKFVNQ
jgi:enoyl-CoA hydratase